MAKKYDHLVKLMLIGDSGVGKTAILVRFVDNEFTPSFMTTIGNYVFYHRCQCMPQCMPQCGKIFLFISYSIV